MTQQYTPDISISDLIKSGAHFGHRRRFWHPSCKRFIYGVRNDLHIINLDETKRGLIQATQYCAEVASTGKKILFVCTKQAGAATTQIEAERCQMPYVNHRWLGGLLSNYKTIQKSVKKLEDYEMRSKPENLRHLTKKEGLRLLGKLRRLRMSLTGVRDMNGLPAALFVIDAGHHQIAIKEARKIGVPVIAVVDTNFSTESIDVVIPGNDDSSHSLNIYLRTIADAVIAGRNAAIAKGAEASTPTAGEKS